MEGERERGTEGGREGEREREKINSLQFQWVLCTVFNGVGI